MTIRTSDQAPARQEEAPKRREVANIRSFIPGKYTINAVYFSGDGKPMIVKIRVVKLNPYVEIYDSEKEVQPRAERTAVSFIVDDKGNVTSIDTNTEVKLTNKFQFKAFRSDGGINP